MQADVAGLYDIVHTLPVEFSAVCGVQQSEHTRIIYKIFISSISKAMTIRLMLSVE